MLESLKSPETPPNEAIANVFHDWLAEEIANSRSNNNSYLNDYEGYAASQGLAYDDPSNLNTVKGLAHYNRLRMRTVFMEDEPVSDKLLALQIFDCTITLSGLYRLQCATRALSQEHYMSWRYGQGPLGVNIQKQVNQRLLDRYERLPGTQDLRNKVISVEELMDATNEANEQRLEALKYLFDGKKIFGMRKVLYAARLANEQKAWLDLGVDHVIFAAQQKDGTLEEVAMLEPKSITDAGVYYPFRKY